MKIQVLATGRRLLGPSREYESRIDREQSPARMLLVPILSVMLGSVLTAFLPLVAGSPLLPPFGLMILLAWRLMRPGMWPAWIGLPLGLFDDLYNGQPFGSSALVWSLCMIAIELLDLRGVWRDYVRDWLIAAVLIILALLAGLGISALAQPAPEVHIIVPQMVLSVLLYPLAVRFCARLDGWRLST
ncbi:MAG: rod shape-determining protein MreD [Sphingorhabdus sp.]